LLNRKKDETRHKKEEKAMKKKIVIALVAGVLIVLGAWIPSYAENVTITGEIIDTYCYVLMGAKGASHRQCAIDCVKAGIPAGILEDGTSKVYVLLPNKDKSPLPKAVLDKMAQKVTITGKTFVNGGSQFLTIESIK
jgi:type 1 fimbria pilin